MISVEDTLSPNQKAGTDHEKGVEQDEGDDDDNVKNELGTSSPMEVPPSSMGQRCSNRSVQVLKVLKANWIKYHLLWLLILGTIIGAAWPLPGKTLGNAKLGTGLCLISVNDSSSGGTTENVCVWQSLSNLCVTFIFLISGMQLKLDKARKALSSRKPILLGYILIFVVTAAFGFAVAAGPKLNPPEFSFGLALFNIMPTTLSACIVITGYAKGNVALALLLSVTTNLLGVAILPLTVTWMVLVFYGGSIPLGESVRVDAADLCLSLIFTVLIPLVLGVLLRIPKKCAEMFDRHNFSLKLISASFLAAIPWMKISQSASTFSQVSAASYVVLIITITAMHIWLLVLCAIVAYAFLDRQRELEDIKCLVLVCAQKTLPVALSVLELLPSNIGGNSGLIALSIVIMQLVQTVMDSALALKWESLTRSLPTTQ